ncbi:MAG: flagellar basal body rod protein FlgC [Candidatus Gastranaerophilales bacterium]|nr:flagellar basal body rod protein FlgC [Candidatus Gastranaerophilales bacterium]
MSFNSLDISATGLYAQRLKMDAISSNIANINTTRKPDGSLGPYVKKNVVFSAIYDQARQGPLLPSQDLSPGYDSMSGSIKLKGSVSFDSPLVAQGVTVSQIEDDKQPFKTVYDPSHPDANEDGFVQVPNINIVNEMVDMMVANRAYEANIASIEASKSMINNALKI